jgi:hypothetical protein
MFDNNSKVSCYNYTIDLAKPIQFFCNLIDQMSQLIAVGTPIDALFDPAFISDDIQIRFSNDAEGVPLVALEELSVSIASYYNKYAVDGINLSNTNILLIHQPSNSIFVLNTNGEDGKKDAREALLKIIHQKNILGHLVSKLQRQDLRERLIASLNIQFSELYFNSIKFSEKRLLDMPFLPLSLFDSTKTEVSIIDESDVTINKTKFQKELDINLEGNTDVSIIKTNNLDENQDLGVVYNEIVFPINPIKLAQWIIEEQNGTYLWFQLKNVFAKLDPRKKEAASEVLSEFKSKMKENDLNRRLSFLTKNIYLKKDALNADDPYFIFFNEVSQVNKLKYLEDFNFFISSQNGKTALGIYTDRKIDGQTSYNLLHWGVDQEGSLKIYRNIHEPESKQLVPVLALKPEIAFYFITNYFEDLLEGIIQECTTDFIKNFHLMVNSATLGELDFVIKKENKICIIEAKTTLNKDVIEAYQEKCFKLLNEFNHLGIELEFYLIAAYSDKTCESYWYFLGEKEGYNIAREGLATVPYNFKIPIPKSSKDWITCIAEPEYAKLKTTIEEICHQ